MNFQESDIAFIRVNKERGEITIYFKNQTFIKVDNDKKLIFE